MKIVRYNENMLDECAEFWWGLYRHMPYVHRPDGYDWVNGEPIGPHYFVRHLQAGLRNDHLKHWCGHVSEDTILTAVERGRLRGILIGSVDPDKSMGTIHAAFTERGPRGREAAAALLTTALLHFQSEGLKTAAAAPPHRNLEVESPIHVALLDAGFGWDESIWPYWGYGVMLGGSLEGFVLSDDIKQRIERFADEGITFRLYEASEIAHMCWAGSDKGPTVREGRPQILGVLEGRVVAQAASVQTWTEWAEEPPHGRILGEAVPYVVPEFRGRGLGKVVFHLGIQEIVRQGATCGFIGATIDSPARFIYRSIGYSYWYTSAAMMVKHLR